MTPEPDGDLARMHVDLKGMSFWGAVAVAVVASCVGGFFFQGWLMWMVYRITGSSQGRWWTARWWSRALAPMGMVVGLAALLTQSAWVLVPSAVLVGLIPVALWRFLLDMTRPGTEMHRSIKRPGWVMTAMVSAGAVLGIVPMMMSGSVFDSAIGGEVLSISTLLILGGYVLMVRPLWQLTGIWAKGAGKPVEHVEAIDRHLRSQGMTTSGTARRLTAKAADLTIEADFAQAPARIVITAPVDLPADVSVRMRRDGDPAGVSMGDPMLGELLLITADDPDAARRRLSGMHEALLASLHARPGSTLSGGVLRVELTGPPFHNTDQVQLEERKPNPRGTVAALEEQLEAARQLVGAIQESARPAAQARRRPISEKIPQ